MASSTILAAIESTLAARSWCLQYTSFIVLAIAQLSSQPAHERGTARHSQHLAGLVFAYQIVTLV